MKNVLLILVFSFSILKAECEILGMKLNLTTKAEIIKNYKHFKENGKKADALLRLDPLQFEIPELESVVLDFNKNNRVTRVGLEYNASLPQYIILKKFLDNKYMTGKGDESYDEQGYFAHFYYKQKNTKECFIFFHFDENKHSWVQYIDRRFYKNQTKKVEDLLDFQETLNDIMSK